MQYYVVFINIALQYRFKSGAVVSLEVLLLYRIVFPIWAFLFFQMKVNIVLSSSVKNYIRVYFHIIFIDYLRVSQRAP